MFLSPPTSYKKDARVRVPPSFHPRSTLRSTTTTLFPLFPICQSFSQARARSFAEVQTEESEETAELKVHSKTQYTNPMEERKIDMFL